MQQKEPKTNTICWSPGPEILTSMSYHHYHYHCHDHHQHFPPHRHCHRHRHCSLWTIPKKQISPHRFKRITGRYPDCNTTQQAINLQYWDSMLWVHHKLTQRKNENSVSLPPGRWIQGCLYMLILGMMGCTDRGRGGWHKIVHARMGAHIYI